MTWQNWIIDKLGGVPHARWNEALQEGEKYRQAANRATEDAIKQRSAAQKAQKALAHFVDNLRIDPDGFHRPNDMKLPKPVFDATKDPMTGVTTLHVDMPTIRYSVMREFRLPEGAFLEQIRTAADKLGNALAQSVKIHFGVAVAEEYRKEI